jgi:hypothetical protein
VLKKKAFYIDKQVQVNALYPVSQDKVNIFYELLRLLWDPLKAPQKQCLRLHIVLDPSFLTVTIQIGQSVT